MQDFTIRVENDKIKYALTLFLDNYKDSVKQFINNVLRNEEGACDSEILKKEGDIYEVYEVAPDKGWVLGEYLGVLAMKPYNEVNLGGKYITSGPNGLDLFLKEPEGQPDLKVGRFISLNDAVKELNSESVQQAIEVAIDRRDSAKRVEEDLQRKAKLKALANNEKAITE